MKKIKRIVILDHEPYSQRKKDHYHITAFQNKGVMVEYWSLHKVLDYTKNVQYNYSETEKIVLIIEDKNILLELLRQINPSNTIIFMEVFFSIHTLYIYNLIKKNNIFWVKLDYYFNPTVFLNPKTQNNVSKENKFIKICKALVKGKITLKKIQRIFLMKSAIKNKINIPEILFLTGNNTEGLPTAKRIYSLDYFDIEEYKSLFQTKRFVDFEYILFLDIMLVNHPDTQRQGVDELISKENYYGLMQNFFEKVEAKYGKPVIIAAHPKSNYTNEFGERLCIKNKTAVLSKYADLILTHGSLSIDFALLAGKPILYIYSKKVFINNKIFLNLLYRMDKAANLINMPILNIDDDLPTDIHFNSTNYKQHYENYLNLLYRADRNDHLSNFERIYFALTQNFTD